MSTLSGRTHKRVLTVKKNMHLILHSSTRALVTESISNAQIIWWKILWSMMQDSTARVTGMSRAGFFSHEDCVYLGEAAQLDSRLLWYGDSKRPGVVESLELSRIRGRGALGRVTSVLWRALWDCPSRSIISVHEEGTPSADSTEGTSQLSIRRVCPLLGRDSTLVVKHFHLPKPQFVAQPETQATNKPTSVWLCFITDWFVATTCHRASSSVTLLLSKGEREPPCVD